ELMLLNTTDRPVRISNQPASDSIEIPPHEIITVPSRRTTRESSHLSSREAPVGAGRAAELLLEHGVHVGLRAKADAACDTLRLQVGFAEQLACLVGSQAH